MAVLQKDLDGCHHVGHVHASCEGVDGDVVLISAGSDLGADILHPSKHESVDQCSANDKRDLLQV